MTVLLCSKHHRLVHEGGFRIGEDYKGRWAFVRPDGIAVPRRGYHEADMTDEEIGEFSEMVNNPPRGGLLSAAEKLREAASPPG